MTFTQNNIGDTLKATSKLIDFLAEKRYTLANIGLKNKQAFDWTKAGLFLEERESKYRRTYSAIEYVWLKIIEELRGFGMSINAIKKLKSFLLQEVDITEMIASLVDVDTAKEKKILKEFQEALDIKYRTESVKHEQNQSLPVNESKLVNTILSILIIQTVINKTNAHLLITKEGKTLVTDGEPFDEHINIGDMLNAPYLTFPLRNVIVNFISREDLISTNDENEVLTISKQEEKVLKLLRAGNLLSLAVRFGKDKEIKLIETEENIELEKVQGRLTDLIMRNKYQTITYKTQDGKITNMRRKTLHK